jgi:membrane-associated protein
MGIIETLIDFVLNLDKYLSLLIQTFGSWTYLILFAVVFCETGLVFTPFFPGDSLIFISGALANNGLLNVELLFVIFAAAAILGDTANYWIGHFLGPKIFRTNSRFLKKEYLKSAHEFYAKHGGKTIIIARFIPVIRTFAPFVAGIGEMAYRRFIIYNIIGGIAWVAVFLFGGYYFGGLEIVKNNLSLSIIIIIVVSFIPIISEYLRHRSKKAVKSKR